MLRAPSWFTVLSVVKSFSTQTPTPRSWIGHHFDETVEHPFLPGLVEFDV
jgi:hypothetical protein